MADKPNKQDSTIPTDTNNNILFFPIINQNYDFATAFIINNLQWMYKKRNTERLLDNIDLSSPILSIKIPSVLIKNNPTLTLATLSISPANLFLLITIPIIIPSILKLFRKSKLLLLIKTRKQELFL